MPSLFTMINYRCDSMTSTSPSEDRYTTIGLSQVVTETTEKIPNAKPQSSLKYLLLQKAIVKLQLQIYMH